MPNTAIILIPNGADDPTTTQLQEADLVLVQDSAGKWKVRKSLWFDSGYSKVTVQPRKEES